MEQFDPATANTASCATAEFQQRLCDAFGSLTHTPHQNHQNQTRPTTNRAVPNNEFKKPNPKPQGGIAKTQHKQKQLRRVAGDECRDFKGFHSQQLWYDLSADDTAAAQEQQNTSALHDMLALVAKVQAVEHTQPQNQPPAPPAQTPLERGSDGQAVVSPVCHFGQKRTQKKHPTFPEDTSTTQKDSTNDAMETDQHPQPHKTTIRTKKHPKTFVPSHLVESDIASDDHIAQPAPNPSITKRRSYRTRDEV